MNYTQLTFWLFFFGILALYWRLGHGNQNRLMLLASYLFYGYWDTRFLFLILISTVIDYIGGLGVAGIRLEARRLLGLAGLLVASSLVLCSDRLTDFTVPIITAGAILIYSAILPRLYPAPERTRRVMFLAISMVANLGILGFFKYCDFFLASFQDVLATMGFEASVTTLGILLPAGISFYTFQAMSYTIDIYRGETGPTTNFGDFALFVCFFPHLVAGPIMRAHTLLPQVLMPRRLQPGAFEEGLYLIVIGLFKKMVIADNMALIANAVFYRFQDGNTSGLSGAEALVGLYAFAFQIYGDFSGYSSIARGISKWLGFELVVNFHAPYFAVSPSDFWRRWHISLSTWLRDYLYIPLGGNRHGRLREYRNLTITMLLGGLWHGASWTFVAWGLYHGLLLSVFRLLGVRDPRPQEGLRWIVRVVIMFHLTCAGWLLFRADSFSTVADMTALIFSDFRITGMALVALALVAFYNALVLAIEWLLDGENRVGRLLGTSWRLQGAVYSYLVIMLVLFDAEASVEFIYFQF